MYIVSAIATYVCIEYISMLSSPVQCICPMSYVSISDIVAWMQGTAASTAASGPDQVGYLISKLAQGSRADSHTLATMATSNNITTQTLQHVSEQSFTLTRFSKATFVDISSRLVWTGVWPHLECQQPEFDLITSCHTE